MMVRALVAMLLAAAILGAVTRAGAQESPQQLARELAHLMLESQIRRGIEEQVAAGMTQALRATLQERLNRRLLDTEWQTLIRIVRQLVGEALPPSRVEELAAEVYVRHFDEAELRQLLEFQRSPVARKVARLAPTISVDIGRAMDREIATSPAITDALDELRREFPVLAPPQSP